ncbi:MAG: NAD(P)H-hydrate dehydratase [Phycisphaerales bacterium]|nr:NAD(P)H-hydrate dehydratase [Phycisphaerales bacterium]
MSTLDSSDPPTIPPRDPAGHKGTFGTVSVVGGCASDLPGTLRMIGAPVLAARGALRAGAGLVRLVMPAPILNAGIAMLPSVTGAALPVDERRQIEGYRAAPELDRQLAASRCMVIGPGLGGAPSTTAIVLRAIQQEDVPIVLDADGLNLLATVPEFWRDLRARVIVTPHPGEYRRLSAPLNITLDPTDPAARPEAAAQLARRLGVIVVLKGAGTVVSDGHRTWICTRGHACLATGGTGDVLAGVIGGLVAQFVGGASEAVMLAAIPEKFRAALAASKAKTAPTLDLFDCARLGVQIHGMAGEMWARSHGQAGLLSEELADLVPETMDQLRSEPSA